jgi:peptide/nickel transport system substrate-binding protein
MDLTNNPERSAAWEFFQAQLRDLGIELDVEYAEAGVVVEECHGAKRHICGLRWRMADPIEMRAVFGAENIGSGFNWTHYRDEEIDGLLNAGAGEPDPEARTDIYRDLQKRIMDAAIFLPIWESPMVHGATPDLKDWIVMPNPEYIWLYDAYLEE